MKMLKSIGLAGTLAVACMELFSGCVDNPKPVIQPRPMGTWRILYPDGMVSIDMNYDAANWVIQSDGGKKISR